MLQETDARSGFPSVADDSVVRACLDAALEYRELGLSVIPVRRFTESDKKREKSALVKWEPFQHRRPSEAEILSWWAQWPEANVAIVMGAISKLDALDADGA